MVTFSVKTKYVASTNTTKEAIWLHTLLTKLDFSPTIAVMNLEWNYYYYQPQSDNEQLVDEMLVLLDKDITIQKYI